MKTLKQLLEELMVEINLHPEIMAAIKSGDVGSVSQNIDRITEYLAQKGINPGYRTDIPRPEGSSRGVLLPNNGDTVEINLDGKAVKVPAVLKYATAGKLDILHMGLLGESESLGQWQNKAENGSLDLTTGRELNDQYRVISHDGKGNYTRNPNGIFPGLIDYDNEKHLWAKVTFASKITPFMFRQLTKTPEFPTGITHDTFVDLLKRNWHKDRGEYHPLSDKWEQQLNQMERHPLVRAFIRHQRETGTPPHDFGQIENLGVSEDPETKWKRVVAVDHGYSTKVQQQYIKLRRIDHQNKKRVEDTNTFTYGGRRKNYLANIRYRDRIQGRVKKFAGKVLDRLIKEHNLHSQVERIISDPNLLNKRSPELLRQVGDIITNHGEVPGFEQDKIASGSSRMVLISNGNNTHIVDGIPTIVDKSAVKVVRKAPLDGIHMGVLGNTEALGTKQNKAENGTIDKTSGQEINNKYRVWVKGDDGNYTTNEFGVFPPLFYHDHKNHQYSEVGYAPRIESGTKFTELTKTESHPEGIVFNDLIEALQREWHKSRGDYHKPSPKVTARLDAVTSHPLFKTLLEHQIETGTPPMDYSQQANWGVWSHRGKEYLVVVDHGYSDEVREAYKVARANDKNDEEGDEWDRRRAAEGTLTGTGYGDSWYNRPPTTPNPPVNITH